MAQQPGVLLLHGAQFAPDVHAALRQRHLRQNQSGRGLEIDNCGPIRGLVDELQSHESAGKPCHGDACQPELQDFADGAWIEDRHAPLASVKSLWCAVVDDLPV